MEPVKLERLLIQEVSGVDDPANQSPGFMVTKSANGGSVAVDLYLLLGNEMEAVTKAADSKQPYGDVTYADPGYQKDGKKRYPLDTEEHIRAAWSYINQEDNAGAYTSEQLASIKSKIKSAMKRIGAEVEGTQKAGSPLAKIKGLLLGAPEGKDEFDMDKDELVAAITEGNEPLVKAVTEAVSKSVAPAEGEGAAEGEAASSTEPEGSTDAPAAFTAEDVQKAVDEAIEKERENTTPVFEALIERLERIEDHLGVAARKSLDGQEADAEGSTEPVEKSAPDLADAIASVF